MNRWRITHPLARAAKAAPVLAALKPMLLAAALSMAGHAAAGPGTGPAAAARSSPAAVAARYGQLVDRSYGQALADARAMQRAIAAFLAAPSPQALVAARLAWLAARESYGQTEAFRFYGGPIDGAKGPEPRINAWPVDESHIDAVQGRPSSGLVNNRRFAITKKSLAAQNERGGEENIATGWHAIEFLLWGQDLSEAGPGDRGFEDYADGKSANAARRRQYLATAVALLVDDLGGLVQAWAPGMKGNYRARFERGGIASVRKMLVGLGALSRGELAGERLEVALDTQQQEDEHSCFSDNTHRDFVAGIQGVRNAWRGEYPGGRGPALEGGASLRELVATHSAAASAEVDASIETALFAALALQPPFDREVVGPDNAPGRIRAFALLKALRQQADALAQAAAVLGLRGLAADAR